MKKIILLVASLGVIFTSCDSDDDNGKEILNLQEGIFVSHEGSGVASGSVSYVSSDLSVVRNDIYNFVNETQLGTFQQSIGFNNGKAYVVVDNANTVAVVDKVTFDSQAVITEGLETPRYITFVGDNGYVTNWGSTADDNDDFVAIIDLDTNAVTGTIDIALGPEQIVARNNKLYISHKGAFSFNNIVSVVDLADNSVSEIIVEEKPDELFFNNEGDLVVLSEGRTIFNEDFTEILGDTDAAIQFIDVTTNTVSETLTFQNGTHPSGLVYENDNYYYNIGNEIFSFVNDDRNLPASSITATSSIYGMSVNDGKIYTVDAKDFASSGTLSVYTVSSDTWSQPIGLGVVPAKIYFQ